MRKQIRNKDSLVGMMMYEMAAPNMMRIIKTSGFDYVIIDAEHGYFDLHQIANLCAVAQGINLPTIIRIPNNDKAYITKLMDMGASGLLLSMCEDKSDLEGVVEASKYAPVGSRGITARRAHTGYLPVDLEEFMAKTNDETVILVQIESKKGIDNLGEILKNEYLDGVLVGPLDLSADLGSPGDFNSDIMKEAMDKIIDISLSNNKACGVIAANSNFINEYTKKGTTINSCNSEVGLFIDSSKEFINNIKEKGL